MKTKHKTRYAAPAPLSDSDVEDVGVSFGEILSLLTVFALFAVSIHFALALLGRVFQAFK